MTDEEKKEKLSKELQELFYRAETHFKEGLGYLEAAYYCTRDLARYEDNPQVEKLLRQVESAMVSEARQMNTSLKSLKTLIKDALGVEMVGVEDYESESED